MSTSTQGSTHAQVQFQPFNSAVDVSFWRELGRRKLEEYHLDHTAKPIRGGFTTQTHQQVPSQLCLGSYSFDVAGASPVAASFPCTSFGTLHNANTLEAFKAFPVAALLDEMKMEMWRGVLGHIEQVEQKVAPDGSSTNNKPRPITSLTRILSRFLLLTFADLKTHKYAHWFCFPALTFDALRILAPTPDEESEANFALADRWTDVTARNFLAQYATFARENPVPSDGSDGVSSGTSEIYFAVVQEGDDSLRVVSLDAGLDLLSDSSSTARVYLAFIDSCPLPSHMGWPARNLLTYASLRGVSGRVDLLAFRDVDLARRSADDATFTVSTSQLASRVFGVAVQVSSPASVLRTQVPRAVGWEKNKSGKSAPRTLDLGAMMDPLQLTEASVDLNLKLMRWRALPELDLALLARSRCLLLGAGTLGCNVSRALLGWGVRRITLVDSGVVSHSNPVRQSLFEFADAREARPKAAAAAEALKRIYPNAEARGVHLSIPMPGHAVSPAEHDDVLAAVRTLETLIREHDAVFLLTDSRESRWLPTVMCAAMNKMCLNTALGFDTYVVMRHGDNYRRGGEQTTGTAASASASSSSSSSSSSAASSSSSASATPAAAAAAGDNPPLGCYFCNDVVAPTDSLSDRTLDRACTVTRPGLAFMSSALVVELFVSLLHHPLRQRAPADLDAPNTSPQHPSFGTSCLGLVPHQLRGFLARFATTLVRGEAFDRCTACSRAVLDAFAKDGEGFVMEALNRPATFLEDLSGLTQLKADTERMMAQLDMHGATDDEDEGADFDADEDDF